MALIVSLVITALLLFLFARVALGAFIIWYLEIDALQFIQVAEDRSQISTFLFSKLIEKIHLLCYRGKELVRRIDASDEDKQPLMKLFDWCREETKFTDDGGVALKALHFDIKVLSEKPDTETKAWNEFVREWDSVSIFIRVCVSWSPLFDADSLDQS